MPVYLWGHILSLLPKDGLNASRRVTSDAFHAVGCVNSAVQGFKQAADTPWL